MPSALKSHFLITGLLISLLSVGQTPRIDSLKKIAQAGPENHRLDALLAVCREQSSLSPDTVYQYAMNAKALALAQHDNARATLADYFIINLLLTKGFTDSSMKAADAALKHLHYDDAGKENYVYYSLLKARALNNLNQPKEGLTILYRLLAEAEKQNDALTQVRTINGIVSNYVTVGQDSTAQQWGYRALHLYPAPLPPAYREAYNTTVSNLGLAYLHRYDARPRKDDLDSASYYITLSIYVSRENNLLGGLAYALALKGAILGYENKPAEGEAMLKESLQLYRQMSNQFYIINTMAVMGNFYGATHQPEKGIAISLEGIELGKNKAANPFLYGNLAGNYKLAGRYREYGETMEQLVAIKDSIYRKNSAEALSEMQTKYDVQKKELTIIRQQLDLTKKNYLIYGSFILLALTLIAGYIFFQNRRKNQLLKLQEMAMEQKKKTVEAVLQAEESERKRIAEDLHDSVAQKMVSARLNLEAFEGSLPPLNAGQQHIYNNIFSLVDESCTEVRSLSHSMMPQAFFQSGLASALESFIDKISHKNLHIRFSAEGPLDRLGKNEEIQVYRILQECVQNVLKHAHASQLDIAIIAENDEIDVTVEDNGRGFDTALLADDGGGMGMKNIRSRIAFLNGKLDITSQPGNGTLVAFYIPVKQS